MPTSPATARPARPAWLESLVQILDSQRGIMEELRPLAEQQASLIEAGRTEELLELLARRQRLLDVLLPTQSEITRLGAERAAELRSLADEQRRDLRERMRAVEEELARILELDRGQEGLRSARDAARGRLGAVDTARTARRAYVKPAAGARFTDRRG